MAKQRIVSKQSGHSGQQDNLSVPRSSGSSPTKSAKAFPKSGAKSDKLPGTK